MGKLSIIDVNIDPSRRWRLTPHPLSRGYTYRVLPGSTVWNGRQRRTLQTPPQPGDQSQHPRRWACWHQAALKRHNEADTSFLWSSSQEPLNTSLVTRKTNHHTNPKWGTVYWQLSFPKPSRFSKTRKVWETVPAQGSPRWHDHRISRNILGGTLKQKKDIRQKPREFE